VSWAVLAACSTTDNRSSPLSQDPSEYVPPVLQQNLERNRARLGLKNNESILYLVHPAPSRPDPARAALEAEAPAEGPSGGVSSPVEAAAAPESEVELARELDGAADWFLKQAFRHRETRSNLAEALKDLKDGQHALLTFQASVEAEKEVDLVCCVWKLSIEDGSLQTVECVYMDRATEPMAPGDSRERLRETLRRCICNHVAPSLLENPWLDLSKFGEKLPASYRESISGS
jgi:hypothetical protein